MNTESVQKQQLITGTFIDEITYDIPSSNWTREQWSQDLDNMQAIGIDTVIFIRGGLGNKTVYPSEAFKTQYRSDFAKLIFEETSKRGMKVIMGMYISSIDWNHGDAAGEIRKNKLFADEIMKRYGDYPSFHGWYIPQETCTEELNICDVFNGLSSIAKDKTPDKKVMISPFFKGAVIDAHNFLTPEQNAEEWHRIFVKCGEGIDICAFQDGPVPREDMPAYYTSIKDVCSEFSISTWVNCETFERDVRCMYYPIPFEELRRKLELHSLYADKIITFEFSHFLSPQSIYPSARNLNRVYREHYGV